MLKKRLKKLTSYILNGMIIARFIGSNAVSAETRSNGGQETASNDNIPLKTKDRVSVHDPSIVKDGNTYYVFGSHIEAAKSTDLQNWTKFTNSYTTSNNVLFGDLSENLAGSFAWANETIRIRRAVILYGHLMLFSIKIM